MFEKTKEALDQFATHVPWGAKEKCEQLIRAAFEEIKDAEEVMDNYLEEVLNHD